MQILNEQQTSVISNKIGYFFDELISKYEGKKYNEAVYIKLATDFECLNDIQDSHIDIALAWKYGKSLENLPKNPKHQATLSKIKNNWGAFLDRRHNNGIAIFQYWIEILPTSFITAAFIAHLCKPEEVPIVDQHNFRAVRYFLSEVNSSENISKNPKTWDEIVLVKKFIDTFASENSVPARELDKYLMMFGKHVAPRV
jgi:hypothetical protein